MKGNLLRGAIFVILTALAIASLRRIEFSPTVRLDFQERDPRALAVREMEGRFLAREYLQVVLPSEDLFAAATLGAVQQLSDYLASLEWVETVVSVTTLEDLLPVEGELIRRRLYQPGAGEEARRDLQQIVDDTPLFRSLLQPSDRSSWVIYLVPVAGGAPRGASSALAGTLAGWTPTAYVWGPTILEEAVNERARGDFLVILFAGLSVVLAAQIVVARSLLTALALWSATVVPTVWTLSLFPVLQLRLETFTMLVPTVIVAISTSYGIHVLHEARRFQSPIPEQVAAGATPVVRMAAFTTALGFASLFLSRFHQSRMSGVLVIVGILCAGVYSLAALPWLVCSVDRPRVGGNATPRPLKRAPTWVIVGFTIAATIVAAGSFGLTTSAFLTDFLDPSTDEAHRMRQFAAYAGGSDEMTLIIDSTREYGLVDPAFFETVAGVVLIVESHPATARVVAYPALVTWMNGRLYGRTTPVQPHNDSEIGESMEALGWGGLGVFLNALVDPMYRTTRILIQLDGEAHGFGEFLEDLGAALRREYPELSWYFSGSQYHAYRQSKMLLKDQIHGVVAYFLLLLIFLVVVYRRLRPVLATMLPPIIGVSTFLGVSGYLNIPLMTVSGVVLALVMGVSVDDAVYCLHSTLNRNVVMRSIALATVQTTVVLALGVLVLSLSGVAPIRSAPIPAIVAMVFATTGTLLVVPRIIRAS